MPKAPPHLDWLIDTGLSVKTACGGTVRVWELKHQDDDKVLSAWARHFRNHYCLDTLIDQLRGKRSRKDYLENIKFPSKSSKLGPPTRAGDFAEILICDYLQWRLGFWVPRVRWSNKPTRDESPKGCDVIGFQFAKPGKFTPQDMLTVFETKAGLSGTAGNRLQDAVNDSAKDHIRIDESLNFIKQKLIEQRKHAEAANVDRFQNPVDIPYKETYGAAALLSADSFDTSTIKATSATKIPKSKKSKDVIPHLHHNKLSMIVIKGNEMMNLVHELYRRAAHEA
jgi:Cap4 SAVED domain